MKHVVRRQSKFSRRILETVLDSQEDCCRIDFHAGTKCRNSGELHDRTGFEILREARKRPAGVSVDSIEKIGCRGCGYFSRFEMERILIRQQAPADLAGVFAAARREEYEKKQHRGCDTTGVHSPCLVALLLINSLLDELYGVVEVVCNVSDRDLVLAAEFQFLPAVPCKNKNGGRAAVVAGLDVDHPVSDNKRFLDVD